MRLDKRGSAPSIRRMKDSSSAATIALSSSPTSTATPALRGVSTTRGDAGADLDDEVLELVAAWRRKRVVDDQPTSYGDAKDSLTIGSDGDDN